MGLEGITFLSRTPFENVSSGNFFDQLLGVNVEPPGHDSFSLRLWVGYLFGWAGLGATLFCVSSEETQKSEGWGEEKSKTP